MADVKVKDIHAMGVEDINTRIKDLKKELIKEKAQIATGTAPKNPHKIRQIRKTIARMLTELRFRELSKQRAKK